MPTLIRYGLSAALTVCVLAGLSDLIHVAQHGFAAAADAFPH